VKALRTTLSGFFWAVLLLAAGVAKATDPAPLPLTKLVAETHIHGLLVDQTNPGRLLLATHLGLYRLAANGLATQLSAGWDLGRLSPHPTDSRGVYAIGHRIGSQQPSVLRSGDGGQTWTSAAGPETGAVDVWLAVASSAQPSTLYRVGQELQVSQDLGVSWSRVGAAPDALTDLAVSFQRPDVLYAATNNGLLLSLDGGRTWRSVLPGAPVTLVEVSPDGSVYVFVRGRGLLRLSEALIAAVPDGSTLESDAGFNGTFGADHLTQLAVDPENPDRLYAVTGRGDLWTSGNGGRSWASLSRF
jgi:photosystem II stability/assembly factor-like uncharacterized protein